MDKINLLAEKEKKIQNIQSMANHNHFILQMKNIDENNYSENLVKIEDGMLKYKKSDEKSNLFFSINLTDLALSEKFLNDKKQYLVIASSISKSFYDIIFKHQEENSLKIFKNFLEKSIYDDKNKFIKKEEIIKINKENKNSTLIEKTEDKKNNSRILNKFNSIGIVNNEKNNFYNFVCDIKDFESEIKKYENVFKSEYKYFKNKNGVMIATNNIENLNKKLNENFSGFESKNSAQEKIKNQIDKAWKFYTVCTTILIILILIFITVNFYYRNYFKIFLTLCLFIFFKSRLLTDAHREILCTHPCSEKIYIMSETIVYVDIMNIQKLLTDFNSMYYSKIYNDKFLRIIEHNENKKFNLTFRRDSYMNDYSQSIKFSDVQFKFYHNVNDNIIYAVEVFKGEKEDEEVLNIFQFKSNEKFNKTKITMYSIIDDVQPGFYVNSVTKSLNQFRNFLKYEIANQCNFDRDSGLQLDLGRIFTKKSKKKIESLTETSLIDNYQKNRNVNDTQQKDQISSTLIGNSSEPPTTNNMSGNIGYVSSPCFVSHTNYLKLKEESIQNLKEESKSIILQIESGEGVSLPRHRLTDEYIVDILTVKSKYI